MTALKLTREKEVEVLNSNLKYFPRGLDDVEDYLSIDSRISLEILGNYLFYYYGYLNDKPVCVIFFMKGRGLRKLLVLYKHLLALDIPVVYTGHNNVFPKHSRKIDDNLYELIKEN